MADERDIRLLVRQFELHTKNMESAQARVRGCAFKRAVIAWRLSQADLSYQAIGERLGITAARVGQLINSIDREEVQ